MEVDLEVDRRGAAFDYPLIVHIEVDSEAAHIVVGFEVARNTRDS